MIDKKNIKINCYFKDKFDIFKTIESDLIASNSVKKGYFESMIERDKIASVALGNYLFLPHCKGGDEHLVLENNILVYHLKDTMIIDNSEIKIIVALALKRENQMEYIEAMGIAFSDSDAVEEILFDKNITTEKIYNFLVS